MRKTGLMFFVLTIGLVFVACQSKVERHEDCVGADCEAQTMKVDAPIISPNGGSHPAGWPISISSSTTGATIKYTTDGTEPSESNGTIYSASFGLSTSDVKAIAIKEGMQNSEITESNYSVTAPNSPTFVPSGGTYNLSSLDVTLQPPSQGCDEIRYTTGTGVADIVYNNHPVTISVTNTTIKAICVKAGVESTESSDTFVLKVAAPSIKHISCPLTPIPQQLSNLGILNSLHATTPPPLLTTIPCTRCIQVTSTATAPYKIYWRTSYVGSSLGNAELAPVTSQWTPYTGPINCNTAEANIDSLVNNFDVEAKVTKIDMTPSDIVSQGFIR